MTQLRTLVVCAVVVVAAAFGLATVASAQSEIGGPTVMLDRAEANVGDQVVLTMSGFESRAVVMSVCGNEARRGSVDCNLPASRAKELAGPVNATTAQITVAEPPAPCPCVVRVSSAGDSEIAIAPIAIAGMPTAPLVEPSTFENPLAVSITARSVSQGLSKDIRASLGGSVLYEVTVTVRNRSTANLERVSVAGTAGRDADDVMVQLDLAPARPISAGQTWQQVVTAELPSPVFGGYTWSAVASGIGASVTAIDETSHTPVLFWLLAAVLVIDLLVLGGRFLYKRIRRSRPSDSDDLGPPGDAGWSGWSSDPQDIAETTLIDVVGAAREPEDVLV